MSSLSPSAPIPIAGEHPRQWDSCRSAPTPPGEPTLGSPKGTAGHHTWPFLRPSLSSAQEPGTQAPLGGTRGLSPVGMQWDLGGRTQSGGSCLCSRHHWSAEMAEGRSCRVRGISENSCQGIQSQEWTRNTLCQLGEMSGPEALLAESLFFQLD